MKAGKRILPLLVAVLMVFAMMPAQKAFAAADTTDAVYWDPNTKRTESQNDCVIVESGNASWGVSSEETWYVVKGKVEISDRVQVSGYVNLILCEDAELIVKQGINVLSPNSFIVWSEKKDGTGKLTAEGAPDECAGIGGNSDRVSGEICLCGGTVTATGGADGAGIGGGSNYAGKVMIDGAMVTATGGLRGAGIGGGYCCHNPCDIKIYSGTVIATGLYGAAGIGGGFSGYIDGCVDIHGGVVEAFSNGAGGMAIGNGSFTETDPVPLLRICDDYGPYKVKAGADRDSAQWVTSPDQRVEKCRERYARIEPCEPHNYEYAVTETTHTGTCKYCGHVAKAERHTLQNTKQEDIVLPTCTESGHYREVGNCTFCNKEVSQTIDTPPLGHKWGEWKVTKEPTATSDGEKQRVCKNDPSHIEKKTIPATGEKVTPTKVSGTLLSKITAKGKSSLFLTWSKVKGADGYDVFFSKCGTNISPKKVKTIKGNKTLKWTKKGLKAKKGYKAVVKAYTIKSGKKTYIRTSPMVHAYTSGGTSKYTNSKGVIVKKTSVSLKAGKTYKVKASVTKLQKGKKLMPTGHAPKLRYVSSNKKIATVSKSGKVTAKSKGSCKVYVIAVNGASKAVSVTVK